MVLARFGYGSIYGCLSCNCDDGERVFEMVNITVRNVKPRAMANVTAPGPYAVGDAIGFSAEGTTDSSLDLSGKCRWDFNTAVDFDDDGYPANDIQDGGSMSLMYSMRRNALFD